MSFSKFHSVKTTLTPTPHISRMGPKCLSKSATSKFWLMTYFYINSYTFIHLVGPRIKCIALVTSSIPLSSSDFSSCAVRSSNRHFTSAFSCTRSYFPNKGIPKMMTHFQGLTSNSGQDYMNIYAIGLALYYVWIDYSPLC